MGGRTREWEGEPENGRANLLVSRISINIHSSCAEHLRFIEDYAKRLTGRFALPSKTIKNYFISDMRNRLIRSE